MSVIRDVNPARVDVLNKLEDIVKSGDEKAAEEIGTIVKDRRVQAEEKVNAVLQKAIEGALGDLSGQVTIEALSTLFSPIQKLTDLVNNVFDLVFNPTPQIRCIQTLCEWRAKLEDLDISNGTNEVEDLLDREESWLLWRRWWTYWDYRYKAWSIYYHTWSIQELVCISRVVQEHAFQFAVLQKKWIKRWSFRFGDHLHESAKKATPQTWKQTVRQSFTAGYAEANQYFQKRSTEILYSLAKQFFFAAIGTKVEEFLMKGLKPVIEPLSKAVPAPVNEVLDVETISRESINKALKDSIDKLVDQAMVAPFVSAWQKQTF